MQKVVKPYFIVPWHFHPEIEIMLVTKGRGTRFVGDSIDFFEPFDLVMVGAMCGRTAMSITRKARR